MNSFTYVTLPHSLITLFSLYIYMCVCVCNIGLRDLSLGFLMWALTNGPSDLFLSSDNIKEERHLGSGVLEALKERSFKSLRAY